MRILIPERVRIWSRQMTALIVKELRQLVRDRLLLGFVVYIFTLHIVVSTVGLSSDLRQATVFVHDGDRSAASREFIYGLRPPYFDVSGELTSARQGVRALDDGSARVVVDIPAGFAETLQRGAEPARVQLLVDSSKTTLGFLSASYATRRAERFGEELASERLAQHGIDFALLPRIEDQRRTWFNFALDDRWPGALAILLTMMTVACVMLPCAAAVREKERGTMEQLLVSPLTPFEIMFAKILAMVFVTVIGSLVSVYLVMQPIFGVPMRGSALLFFAMVALYAFANAGLGLTLATFARSAGQAGLLVILTVMPMIQLSGLHSPVESMPAALRSVVSLSPLYHFVQIAFGIMFRGQTLSELSVHLGSMLAIGAALFVLGLLRFRRQFA